MPLLKHCIVQRWKCPTHGYFESWNPRARRRVNCPEARCRMTPELCAACDSMTTHRIPDVNRPRPIADQEAGFQVTKTAGITTRAKSDAPSRLRAGKRATGRKRGDRKPERVKLNFTYEEILMEEDEDD